MGVSNPPTVLTSPTINGGLTLNGAGSTNGLFLNGGTVSLYAHSSNTIRTSGSLWGDQGFRSVNAGEGIWGAVPPGAQPTVAGSRGGNAALASLLTAIAATGLVIDGSSA